METVGNADEALASGRKFGSDAADGANRVKNVASAEIKNLIADVEDLVARIADLKDADVARVRGKVLRAVGSAKEILASRTETLRRQAKQAATTADDYVHDRPWQAVGHRGAGRSADGNTRGSTLLAHVSRMRLLWSLPKAAPALLRHLAGYAELAVEDLEQSQHDFRARLMAGALVGLSSFFVLLCLCMAGIGADLGYALSRGSDRLDGGLLRIDGGRCLPVPIQDRRPPIGFPRHRTARMARRSYLARSDSIGTGYMTDLSRSRDETLAKLAQTRAEISRLLDPPPKPASRRGLGCGR